MSQAHLCQSAEGKALWETAACTPISPTHTQLRTFTITHTHPGTYSFPPGPPTTGTYSHTCTPAHTHPATLPLGSWASHTCAPRNRNRTGRGTPCHTPLCRLPHPPSSPSRPLPRPPGSWGVGTTHMYPCTPSFPHFPCFWGLHKCLLGQHSTTLVHILHNPNSFNQTHIHTHPHTLPTASRAY